MPCLNCGRVESTTHQCWTFDHLENNNQESDIDSEYESDEYADYDPNYEDEIDLDYYDGFYGPSDEPQEPFPHIIQYAKGPYGTRTNKGFVANIFRCPEDHDIIGFTN